MSDWKVRFWGTRGSIASPGPETVRYGGNTSCVELRCGDQVLICDSGTGIRPLGLKLLSEFQDRPIQGDIFIGHTHWDHIQGFPFFTPAYLKRNRFNVYSAQGMGFDFENIIRGQMHQNYFPVETGDMQAQMDFRPVNGPFTAGKVAVTTAFSNHPGVNIVYRFTYNMQSVTYLTDHENYQAQVQKPGDHYAVKQDRLLEDFCRGTDLLICDSQYTDEDYPLKRGWGHSRWRDTVALALTAGVKRVALFHHEPTRTDPEIDAIVRQCHDMIGNSGKKLECFAASEGQLLEF